MKSSLIKALVITATFAALAGCGQSGDSELKPPDASNGAHPDPRSIAADQEASKRTNAKSSGVPGPASSGLSLPPNSGASTQ